MDFNKVYKLSEIYFDLVSVAGKYDHINFKPPQSVANAAKRGLKLREKNDGKGGLSTQEAGKQGIGSGVQRASDLSNRETLSPSTVKRMKAFFDRHEKNKKVDKGKKPHEDKGYISHLLWGGDSGKAWANKIVEQMETADKRKKKAQSNDSLISKLDQVRELLVNSSLHDDKQMFLEKELDEMIRVLSYNDDIDLATRIRDTYFDYTMGQTHRPVSIADIKSALPSYSNEEIDSALLDMLPIKGFIAYPEDNPQVLQRNPHVAEGAADFNSRKVHWIKFER